MKRRNIDTLREVRLWTTTVIVPLATLTVMACNNPVIVEKVEKLKNEIRNRKTK